MHIIGSAGCGIDAGNKCGHLIKKDGKWYCVKYREILKLHFAGEQPWRLEKCGDDAMAEGWSNIIKARQ